MTMVYYVTAFAIPRGATEMPKFRTDMGKFLERAAAEQHVEALRGPHFAEVRVEEREE